ncbi:MAG: hypothetical protein ABSE39_11705 [Candidatus Bathyarchaeia archaeon]
MAVIPIYVRSLIFFNTPSAIFDVSHFVAVLALSIILVRSKLRYGVQVFLVLLSMLTLMIIVPLRFPEGIITNGPDMIYELQIMRNIAATGAITFDAPTRYALGYVFTPTQETLLVMVSMVLGASSETVLKYAGPVFGVLTLAFLLGFYRAYLPKKEALLAVFLAGSCSVFLQASTTHQTLALVFLSVALYSLTKSGATWRFLTVLSVFATVSTHEFTAIVSSVFFISAVLGIIVLSRWFGFKRGQMEDNMLKMPALMVTTTLAWLAFVALPFFGVTLGFVSFVIGTLLTGGARVAFPLTLSNGLPNTWERVVGNVGVVLFATTCMTGFIVTLVKRGNVQYRQFLPYGVSGALIFFIGLISYVRFHQATDLLSRGFIYVYFFGAPLALYAILRISSPRKAVLRQVACICLICIIVVAGVYYQYPRYTIDNSAPIDIEDVRFPLIQWQAGGYFVLGHMGGSSLWGDKIAFDYVGGYGERNVIVLDPSLNLTLTEWMSTTPSSGDIVILRQSMVTVPYANYQVSARGLHEILVTHDIIYSSGEVVMVAVS